METIITTSLKEVRRSRPFLRHRAEAGTSRYRHYPHRPFGPRGRIEGVPRLGQITVARMQEDEVVLLASAHLP